MFRKKVMEFYAILLLLYGKQCWVSFPRRDVVMDTFNTIDAACGQQGRIKENRNEKETYVKPEINHLNSLRA